MNKFITTLITILLLNAASAFAHTPQLQITNKSARYYEEARFKKNEISKPFYYVRHGQTDSNKQKVAMGDIPLNENGILQAEEAGKLLRDKNIKIIVASPLLRTKQTAEIINKTLNVPIVYHDGLKEGDWGIVKGEDVSKPSENKKIWLNGGEVPGSESLYQFQTRIHNTIKEVINKHDGVLIVSHSSYYINLGILLTGELLKPARNGVPIYLEPISETSGKALYKITALK
jgi:broad specificity phosphatase PhoE